MDTRLTRQQSGFTLVELLIVVIILAILAAIVVPQFSSTTDDAKESTMRSNLAAMRSAMELYYIQHGEYPGKLQAAGGTGCAVPATATGGAGQAESFTGQMLYYSNANGDVCNFQDNGNYPYGPYLKGGALPENEAGANPSSAVNMVSSGSLDLAAEASNPGGWRVDFESGLIIVNTTEFEDL